MASPHHPPADATKRFSDRVGNYVRTRPGYPAGVFALLQERCGLGPACVVADIGAGTGIFTRALLERGASVHAIEPNAAMREALVAALGANPNLRASDGTAENSGLADASVDLVVAAQAFHWFDRDAARREFTRILKPRGWCALVWNTRLENTTPFLVGYENLLRRWSTDYGSVNHRNVGLAAIEPFFAPGKVERHAFRHEQVFDFDGVRGRLLSSSYAPAEGHPNHAPMLAELRAIFDAHNESGRVRFEYETEVYLGRFPE
jgi:SAM-dependent methyltransferase